MWKLFSRQPVVEDIPSPMGVLADLLIYKIKAMTPGSPLHRRDGHTSLVEIPIRDGMVKIKITGYPEPPHTYGGKKSFEAGVLIGREYNRLAFSVLDQARINAALRALRLREEAKARSDEMSQKELLAVDVIERMI
jgi:hypothetical protein